MRFINNADASKYSDGYHSVSNTVLLESPEFLSNQSKKYILILKLSDSVKKTSLHLGRCPIMWRRRRHIFHISKNERQSSVVRVLRLQMDFLSWIRILLQKIT